MKDAINCLQHGVSLKLAREIAWDEVVLRVDKRRDYGEVREVGYMPIHGRMFCVVFTRSAKSRRIISLRRANDREIQKYAKET
ncbi:BrnT family toxin [Caballeronia sp. LZ065]|uniref:BrnT family toxin n=1 Tax=Caballeronia sp. LZ065 TaxID=3038571 RepID=UPI00286CE8D3|nr:BrnT family toxin [Caballeronia sp. LZ065]